MKNKKPKNRIIITDYTRRCWGVADAQIIRGGITEELISINRYYEITLDWLIIYKSEGGCDNITRGEILRRIDISDLEIERIEINK